jgi:hypothetical protein
VRPSSILIVYLLFFPLDIIAARNLYLQGARLPIASVLLATAGVKFALWLVETGEKQSYLKAKYQNLPPESVSGIISRSFLWWLNLLFAQGSRKVLQVQNLFALDNDLAAENLGANLQNAWDIRGMYSLKSEMRILIMKSKTGGSISIYKSFVSKSRSSLCRSYYPTLVSHCVHIRTAISHHRGLGVSENRG